MNFELVTREEKIEKGISPYVTFPITKACTLKCQYCGDGGEMSLCDKEQFKKEDLFEWHKEARKLGVEKFRITGGEPLLHKDFTEIVETIAKDASYVLVNSNGTLIKKYKEKWINLPRNVHFVVNYHANDEETYNKVTCTENYYEDVKEGIKLLVKEGMLHRVNTVYCDNTKEQIYDIIDFCKGLGIGLKIQDVVSVPWQFDEWEDIYVDTTDLEKEFTEKASLIVDHKYAKGFGTPSKIFTIDGVNVTLKSVRNGSHYEMNDVCSKCEYYPCHEGIYDLFVFPDNTAAACNWVDVSRAPFTDKHEQLEWLIDKFRKSEYVEASDRIKGMYKKEKKENKAI